MLQRYYNIVAVVVGIDSSLQFEVRYIPCPSFPGSASFGRFRIQNKRFRRFLFLLRNRQHQCRPLSSTTFRREYLLRDVRISFLRVEALQLSVEFQKGVKYQVNYLACTIATSCAPCASPKDSSDPSRSSPSLPVFPPPSQPISHVLSSSHL